MNFRINGVYLTRSGCHALILSTEGHCGDAQLHGRLIKPDANYLILWSGEGRALGPDRDSPNDLMAEIATVWTQAGCGDCEKEIALLKAEGYAIDERDADNIENDPDRVEVRAQLAIQHMALPIVRIAGEFKRRGDGQDRD